MPQTSLWPDPLAPNSERQAFIIALAETGNPEVAERLVTEALENLGNTLPPTVEETNSRFFLLLISGLIDWQWQRRCWAQPLEGLLGLASPTPAPAPAWARISALPAGQRRAYLLRRLAPLGQEQIADILELPPDRVRHPTWDAPAAPPVSARRRYRGELRTLAADLRRLQDTLSPSREQRLQRARLRALSTPTNAEHRALYLWQQALRRQFMPTGAVMLLLVAIWLLGSMLYF